jgi:hypothetical protein
MHRDAAVVRALARKKEIERELADIDVFLSVSERFKPEPVARSKNRAERGERKSRA